MSKQKRNSLFGVSRTVHVRMLTTLNGFSSCSKSTHTRELNISAYKLDVRHDGSWGHLQRMRDNCKQELSCGVPPFKHKTLTMEEQTGTVNTPIPLDITCHIVAYKVVEIPYKTVNLDSSHVVLCLRCSRICSRSRTDGIHQNSAWIICHTRVTTPVQTHCRNARGPRLVRV